MLLNPHQSVKALQVSCGFNHTAAIFQSIWSIFNQELKCCLRVHQMESSSPILLVEPFLTNIFTKIWLSSLFNNSYTSVNKWKRLSRGLYIGSTFTWFNLSNYPWIVFLHTHMCICIFNDEWYSKIHINISTSFFLHFIFCGIIFKSIN